MNDQPNALQSVIIPRWMFWGLVILIALAVGYSGLTLTKWPIVFVDEGWFSNSAWNWVVNGVHFDTMHRGPLDQFGYEWIRRYVFAESVWGIGFALLGVGFTQARLVSWVIGIGVLIATGWIARRLYGLPVALLAVLLLVTSQPFLRASHLARQEILLTLLGLAGFGFGVHALQTDRWWAHVLGAFLIGFAINIHQNGLNYVLGFGLMYLVHYGRSLFMKRGTWLAAISGATGIAIFVVMHILPNPQVYFIFYNMYLSSTHQLPVLSLLGLLRSVFGEIATTFDFDKHFLAFGLIIAAATGLLMRRSQQDRHLLAFIGGSWLGFVLLVGSKTFLYPILLYPFLMIMVAAAAPYVLTRVHRQTVKVLVLILIAGMLVGNILPAAQNFIDHQEYDYGRIVYQLKSVIPDKSRVMGLPNWWFGFVEDDYRSNFTINFYSNLNGLAFEEALALIRPEYIVVDFIMSVLLVDENEILPRPLNANPIPRKPFESLIEERGTLVLEFDDPWHGTFKVYRLQWE